MSLGLDPAKILNFLSNLQCSVCSADFLLFHSGSHTDSSEDVPHRGQFKWAVHSRTTGFLNSALQRLVGRGRAHATVHT